LTGTGTGEAMAKKNDAKRVKRHRIEEYIISGSK